MQLFPHQRRVLNETQALNRVAYYLDMGLGKTFVGSEKANSFNEKILVVCQKSKMKKVNFRKSKVIYVNIANFRNSVRKEMIT